MSRSIGRKQFKTEVMESESGHLSLVQFKTEWSGACQIIAPVFEELSNCYDGIADFFSIDVEQEADMEKEYRVLELPTILFFKNGELIDHVIGLTPRNALISKIESALA